MRILDRNQYIAFLFYLLSSIFMFVSDISRANSQYMDILNFWFETNDIYSEIEPKRKWFAKDPQFDELVTNNYRDFLSKIDHITIDSWKKTTEGTLALILLFDQFPRHIFRANKKSFEFDDVARELVRAGIQSKLNRYLNGYAGVFFYMPLQHSETLVDQALSMQYFAELFRKDSSLKKSMDMARKHFEVIEQFGRFPHRNRILNRKSTLDELDYLNDSNSTF